MIPRVGHAPDATRRYMARPGAYAVLPIGTGFLLTAQIADSIDIQLPGGGIDAGESPLRALHREVWEETGWRIANPRHIGVFRRFVFMPEYDLWAEKICRVFVARPLYQTDPPMEPDHETLVLPPDDAIAALGNDGDKMMLRRYLLERSGA